MPAFILLILVYIIAIGCVFIMKKIQPESADTAPDSISRGGLVKEE